MFAGRGGAQHILRWLRPGNGLGPDIYYRSLPAPGTSDGGLPPPLAGEPPGERVVIPGALDATAYNRLPALRRCRPAGEKRPTP